MGVREASATYADLSIVAADVSLSECKQSEVGPIPTDWTILSLASLSEFITKGSTPTTYGFRWEQDGILFLRSECVAKDGLDLSQSMRISSAAHTALARSQIGDGNILITITGNVGRVVLYRGPEVANINQHIARVRVRSHLSAGFVYHYLSLPQCRDRFASITTGQAYPQISLAQVRAAPIALPPTKVEQEAIAEALNDADALIESLQQLIAKKRQIKQGATQTLLTGQQRLPSFAVKQQTYKTTEAGLVPQDWNVGPLAELCSMKSGEAITTAGIDESSLYPCYGGNGLRGFTARFTHDGSYVLIGRQGALCGNVVVVSGKFFASEHAVVVTASARTDTRWLAFVLDRMRLNQYSESSAQPGLSVAKLLQLISVAPSTKAEQAAIATVLTDIDAEIAALETRLSKAREIKQGMMQALLTGAIRLPLTEAA